MNKSIHYRIRERRIELGLSQDQLAAKMGYKSRSSINKIESGQTDIARNKLVKLAEALLTTPAYLMGWEEPKSKQNPDFQPLSNKSVAPTNSAVDNIGIMKSNSPLQFVVADNSFFPTISMNDTVSVDTLRQANPNKSILAVQATGASGEILGPYVVLRFFYTPTGIVIYSPNPQFQQVFYSYQYLKDAHPIIGVVTAVMFNQENI